MNYYDGKIELEREVAALNAALAAERADCARAKESLDERCKTIIEQRTRIDFLDPYCKRLEEELAAEREKVVELTKEMYGLKLRNDNQARTIGDCHDTIKNAGVDPCIGVAKGVAAILAQRDALADRVRGLEGALQPLVPNQHGDYGGPLVAGKWWFEDGSEQVISSDNGIKAANALTPPAPAGPVTLKPGHDHDDNDPYMPAPAKAAREGGAQT